MLEPAMASATDSYTAVAPTYRQNNIWRYIFNQLQKPRGYQSVRFFLTDLKKEEEVVLFGCNFLCIYWV